jgi:hypothetical protein
VAVLAAEAIPTRRNDDAAAAPIPRLLRVLRDKEVTYRADEALAVAALVLADPLPEEAAVVLTASQSLHTGAHLSGPVEDRSLDGLAGGHSIG